MKLRELAVKYRISSNQLTDWFGGFLGNTVKGLTFGIIGRNLLTITDYSGYDPEVNIPTQGRENDIPTLGIDLFAYPKATSVEFGLITSFK